MTAFERFYKAIEDGQIPASVPVVSIDGSQVGIATQALPILGNDAAERLALSSDPADRAVAAVYACRYAVESVQQKFETVQPIIS